MGLVHCAMQPLLHYEGVKAPHRESLQADMGADCCTVGAVHLCMDASRAAKCSPAYTGVQSLQSLESCNRTKLQLQHDVKNPLTRLDLQSACLALYVCAGEEGGPACHTFWPG
jgi:hypothetical protein